MCCKNCTKRHFKCHSNCEEYRLYKEKLDTLNNTRINIRDRERDFYNVVFDTYNKKQRKAQRYK